MEAAELATFDSFRFRMSMDEEIEFFSPDINVEKEEEELFGYLERDEGVGILMFVIMGGWGIVKVSLLVMVLLQNVNPAAKGISTFRRDKIKSKHCFKTLKNLKLMY